jgi:hypothetical protein
MKVHEDGKTKIVSGFEVQVNSPTEEIAKDIAEKKAKKLVDILAILSTTPLEYTPLQVSRYIVPMIAKK